MSLTEVFDFINSTSYFTTSNLNENGQNESHLAGFVLLKKYCYVFTDLCIKVL